MVHKVAYDTVVIGAGAAGMAAAATVCESGHRVALLDREECLGGILLQCVHNGFGLHHFKQELTGPEYADEYARKVLSMPIDVFLDTTVINIRGDAPTRVVEAVSPRHGVLEISARAVILSMGCRERNRGNIGIPGTRPSGVFTAGLAQRLLNVDGYLPGKRVVIVGSGDIGLIMARRMSWMGAQVLCVVEILPYPSGLTRNIVQCLQDFAIPLHLSHSVTRIFGSNRVEGVEISPLENGVPVPDKAFTVACDTILLSVGLIPENELSKKAGVKLHPGTGGPVVDHNLHTTVDGVFACGNVLHVHDLVDFVSEEAQRCGRCVDAYLRGSLTGPEKQTTITAGANLRYVVPNSCVGGEELNLLMRPLVVADRMDLTVRQGQTVLHRRTARHVRPAEMIKVTLKPEESLRIAPGEPVEVSLTTSNGPES